MEPNELIDTVLARRNGAVKVEVTGDMPDEMRAWVGGLVTEALRQYAERQPQRMALDEGTLRGIVEAAAERMGDAIGRELAQALRAQPAPVVNVPQQAAPVVNVEVPAAPVPKVELIEREPEGRVKFRFVRGDRGEIISAYKERVE